MKKFFTLLLSVFLFTMVMGQTTPTAVIKKATVSPVIDGQIDIVWADANVYNIDKIFKGETPTLGAAGTTTWQALWDDKGIYILVKVEDDIFAPAYGATDSYKYDKVEIYFNTNFDLKDGKGPNNNGNGEGNGHYQFAPEVVKDSLNSGKATSTGGNGAKSSYNVTDPSYLVEYFVPFSKLIDGQGIEMDKTGEIGFDVSVTDNDIAAPGAVRNRAVWANIGTIAESWSNMNDAGSITLDGVDAGIPVETITLTPGTITTDNGTLQMTATILPANATNQILKWTVENGTGKASISSTGLVTAIENGTVTIKGAATDGSFMESTAVVTISGQAINKFDVWNNYNLIKNWNFANNLTGWANYHDAPNMVQPTAVPVVQNGIVVMQVGLSNVATEIPPAAWHYQFNQTGLTAEANVPYILHFKTWAAQEVPAVVDFESASSIVPADGGDQYVRYGTSSDAEAKNLESEWFYTTPVDPTWFTFHVVFNKMIPTTIQKIGWLLSLSNTTIMLDSVLLVKESEYAILSTTGSKTLVNSINKVYPNPVGDGNSLFVELSSVNTKVAIYNAVGQKLMEKLATRNLVKFDVSSLRKGMYFVKLGDGSIQKFVK